MSIAADDRGPFQVISDAGMRPALWNSADFLNLI